MRKAAFKRTDHRRPSGMSGLGIMGTIILVGVVVVLVLRLGPHYIDFQTLDTVMEGLPAAEVHKMSKAEIREMLLKRYKINNIRDLKISEVVSIERKKDATAISIDYEVREPMVYNIDAVLTFSKQYSYR